MNIDACERETLAPRLELLARQVEEMTRQNRWMKRIGGGLLVLVGTIGLLGSQNQTQDKSREQGNFVLRDQKGSARAWLGMTKDGPSLRFLDEGGKDRLWLGVQKDTPGLVFYDGQGKRRAALSVANGPLCLVFYDRHERGRAWLVMTDAGPSLHLLGQGTQHAGLSVEIDGVAAWHHDKDGGVHTGPSGLKQGAGLYLYGEAIDPLFGSRSR